MGLQDYLTSSTSIRTLVVLLHFLWQGVAIAGLAWVVGRAMRRATARARYSLFTFALALTAVAPLVTFAVIDPPSTATPPAPHAAAPPAAVAPVAIAPTPAVIEGPDPIAELSAGGSPIDNPTPSVEVVEQDWSWRPDLQWEDAAVWIIPAYLAGVALLLARLAIGVHGGWRLRRVAELLDDGPCVASLVKQASAWNLRHPPTVYICRRVIVPTVIGLWRPVILLPSAVVTGLSPDQVEAVLIHELAHIHRWDHIVNVLQRIVEAALFFHPAIWWISHRVRVEREHCCDDMVVGVGVEATRYAASLLDVAEIGQSAREWSHSVAAVPATGRASQLSDRVRRLLGASREESWRMNRGGGVALIALLTLLAAGVYLNAEPRGANEENRQQEPVEKDDVRANGEAGGDRVNPAREEPTFAAELPNGTRVKLLGVSTHPAKPDSWWRPDGAPLAEAPAAAVADRLRTGEGKTREFAVQVKDPPRRAATRVLFENTVAVSGGRGKDDLHTFAVAFPKLESTTVRVGVAENTWEQVFSLNEKAEVVKQAANHPLKAKNFVLKSVDDNLIVTFEHAAKYLKTHDIRVTVLTTDGRATTSFDATTESASDGRERSEFEFAVDKADTESVVAHTRAFDWIVFRNVSLQSGVKTKVVTETNLRGAEGRPAQLAEATWKPLGDAGLFVRLRAAQMTWQSWQTPQAFVEFHNRSTRPISEQELRRETANMRFFYADHRSRDRSRGRRLAASPGVHLPTSWRKDIPAGETLRVPLRLALSGDTGPHRHVFGWGESSRPEQVIFRTNLIAITHLPPGVRTEAEMRKFLKPYQPGEHSVLAGFVPNKQSVVLGEPMFVTFVVLNLGSAPVSIDFGGDYRGSNRHDRFKIKVYDETGKLLDDPNEFGNHGGLSQQFVAPPYDGKSERVDLTAFRTFGGPGKYTVECGFTLEPAWNAKPAVRFKTPVTTSFSLEITPRDGEHVQVVLDELVARSLQTRGKPLRDLVGDIVAFGKELAADDLATMAAGGDREHRIAAINGLGSIASDESRDALLGLAKDDDLEIHVAAINSLGSFADGRALAAVSAALQRREQRLQTAAVGSLGRMKTAAALDALLDRYPRADDELSASILRAMGVNQEVRAFPVVAEALNHDAPGVRKAALEAIVQFPVELAAKELRSHVDSDDMDFREQVVRKLAESLRQPIEASWLPPVVRSRRHGNTIGDVPRLLRLYTKDRAVPTLLSCLDFDDPSIRNYYNMTIISNQLPCRGGLAIPWIGDLNRDGAAEELAENRRILRILKEWVEYDRANPTREPPLPWELEQTEEEQTWGASADGLSIRARTNRSVWPNGLPQVLVLEAHGDNGGSVIIGTRPARIEVELNGQWYYLPDGAGFEVGGDWHAYTSRKFHQLQMDERWLSVSDDKPFHPTPGDYTARVRLKREAGHDYASSKPVKFTVIE
ncbi:MAG: M56 family metallopeptidase [Pirellulaceae bacterium]|jgi:beta-lactamase regulating signal transducer with metallopeptidase domain|nr:M56 family metallopeptidase [Pirellulaceae bacterium]MDP7018439.1 M56 family metallopeptidase [Pirellulaceae bacterium]